MRISFLMFMFPQTSLVYLLHPDQSRHQGFLQERYRDGLHHQASRRCLQRTNYNGSWFLRWQRRSYKDRQTSGSQDRLLPEPLEFSQFTKIAHDCAMMTLTLATCLLAHSVLLSMN